MPLWSIITVKDTEAACQFYDSGVFQTISTSLEISHSVIKIMLIQIENQIFQFW